MKKNQTLCAFTDFKEQYNRNMNNHATNYDKNSFLPRAFDKNVVRLVRHCTETKVAAMHPRGSPAKIVPGR